MLLVAFHSLIQTIINLAFIFHVIGENHIFHEMDENLEDVPNPKEQ